MCAGGQGVRGQRLSPGERFRLEGDWALWAVTALLPSRGSETVDALVVESAPEFFFLDLCVPRSAAYPLLERTTSGNGQTIDRRR